MESNPGINDQVENYYKVRLKTKLEEDLPLHLDIKPETVEDLGATNIDPLSLWSRIQFEREWKT
jgi:hypothetical protein